MSELIARVCDITTLDVDAIVNAANEGLLPGGGVSGAIHRAAGPELVEACARVAPCPVGQARLTPGFRLRARHVIHAVGPIWRGGRAGEFERLASAYRAAMMQAKSHGLRSIAFPAISTGLFAFPLAEATGTAVAAVRAELESPGSIELVIFSCASEGILKAYVREGIEVG